MRLTRQTRTLVFALFGVVFMTGLAWASVPLYRMFCQVTGYQGTTQRGSEAPGSVHRQIRVDFDANVSSRLAWTFKPENPHETIDIGARDQAGRYFTKIQCFCFTQQTLKPGETVRMPVIFFVDPKILNDPDARDIETITLSYTFYPVDSGKKAG